MNIVFWLLTLFGVACIWFLFNPVFKIIGKVVLGAINNVKKNISEEKGNEDNERVCLPLRLGKEVFEYTCPYAKAKGFEYEYMDECHDCPYLVTVSGVQGRIILRGDKKFLGGDTDEEDPVIE